MTAQIRPNRMEVSDRFPMLGFAVRTDQPDVEAEVVLANDIGLFSAQNRQSRTAANFYSSQESGMLNVPRGEGVFVVPPEVLARFIGSEKIYFGLATGHKGNGGLVVDAVPRDGSPYVSLRGFTGRTLRRGFGGARPTTPKLEWTGDAPKPGSEKASGGAPATIGATAGGSAPPATPSPSAPYDDGFGPMPAVPARESSWRGNGARRPAQMGLTMSSGTTPDAAIAWLRQKIEQGVQAAGSHVDPPVMCYLGDASGAFITAWRAAFGLSGLISPVNAFLAAIPSLAARLDVTLSVGPVLDTPLFGAGVGVVFAPDGSVAVFGQGEINADPSGLLEFVKSLKLVLAAKIKLGYNRGGIAKFADITTVAGVTVGDELVGGSEIWLDSGGSGIGGAVSIGVGFALELSADAPRPRGVPFRAARQLGVAGNGTAIAMGGGTTAAQALDWIRRRVEQVVDAVGSEVSPPSLYRLGANSATFLSVWDTVLTPLSWTGGIYPILKQLPALARSADVTLSIGPALDTPVFGAGVGVVFGPDGQVALFGQGEISVDASGIAEFVSSLKLALQAKLKLGYNNRGIDGFASIGKVASLAVGEEIVVGAEVWLDGGGQGLGGAVSIGAGFALELSARDGARTPAGALVFDQEDMQRAQTLARDFSDLFQWMAPQAIADQMTARGFEIQKIADAAGDLNLDFYKVRIDRFPEGWDGPRLLEQFIRNVNSFVDTDKTSFDPYSPGDASKIASADPVGAVFNLNIEGPDDAAVVISSKGRLSQGQYYSVTTIRTSDTGDHPVSGHRQFGYFTDGDSTIFYSRGADRSTAPIPGTEWLIWRGADALWRSFQSKVAGWVNANGGSATILPPFSERFNATAVRLTYGHFDTAQGFAMDAQGADAAPGMPAYVPPPMPNNPRERATRIGGGFGQRIGEALDLGLDAKALAPLLDKLDPPAAAQPLGFSRSLGADPWSLNWDGVDLIAQPTGNSCWATTLSMLRGWHDQKSYPPDATAQACGRSINEGLPWADRAVAAAALGLGTVAPACFTPDGFRDLIAGNGPLYVGKIMSDRILSGHAVLVVGMYFDGTNYFLRIADPWDRGAGAPGAPDPYGATHTAGSRYIMRYEDFQNEYEMAAAGTPAYVQIIYAGVPLGRSPSTGTSAPAGYAMAAGQGTTTSPRRSPARVMDAGAIATIVGTAVTIAAASSSGDVDWRLPAWEGKKNPPSGPAVPAPAPQQGVIALTGWPSVGGTYMNTLVRWHYDGTSIGPVYVEPGNYEDTVGWGITVTGTIQDDPRLYPRSSSATVLGPDQVPSLTVVLTYQFQAPPLEDDPTAVSRIKIFADGTHEIDNEWIKRPSGIGDQIEKARYPETPDQARTNLPFFAS